MCNVFNSFWNITTGSNFWGMSFKVKKIKKKKLMKFRFRTIKSSLSYSSTVECKKMLKITIAKRETSAI